MVEYVDSVLRVEHYTGSVEVFFTRGKSRTADNVLARQPREIGGEYQDDLMRWLKSFSEKVGVEMAHYLTEV